MIQKFHIISKTAYLKLLVSAFSLNIAVLSRACFGGIMRLMGRRHDRASSFVRHTKWPGALRCDVCSKAFMPMLAQQRRCSVRCWYRKYKQGDSEALRGG